MIPLQAGRLLVARPPLDDPHFVRSVVLLLAHDDDHGSMGVILNRPGSPLSSPTQAPLSSWIDTATGPHVDFYGGPVAPESFICLTPEPGLPGGVRSLDIIEDFPSEHIAHRLFRGCSSWGPYQLANECTQGAWWVVESHINDVVDLEPDDLWNKVLQRQDSVLRRLAQFPDDPSNN
jgi:putative transcriptional regulator